MANQLKMAEHQAIIGLARRHWSYCRIATELGVDRETVSRQVRAALRGPPDSMSAVAATSVLAKMFMNSSRLRQSSYGS